MCGIFATLSPKASPSCTWAKSHALVNLSHRGPDYNSQVHIDLSWTSIDLSMARLKIVDQTDLTIPFHFPYLHTYLAFNGEIYNWKSLRAQLSNGTPWQTNCDAEIIARAWKKDGIKCLNSFNGMWGFILVDYETQEVFISRDRAGKKPLYYTIAQTHLYISSEIKALPICKEEVSCLDMTTLEFDFREATPVKGVRRLNGGNYILLDSHTAFTPQPQKWWELPARDEKSTTEYDYYNEVSNLKDLLIDAVRLRSAAEVPVAIQISGGLDSAIIQSIAKKEHLYCITFPEANNIDMARLAAQEYAEQVHPITFNYQDLLNNLKKIIYHLDTPATWSSICLWFLAQQISKDGCKIILSGEGADELFGGYSRYRILYHIDQIYQDPHLTAYLPMITNLIGSREDLLAKLLDRSTHNSMIKHANSIAGNYQGKETTLVDQMQRIDFHTTMQVLLRMGDRMAAAWGLENRCPFLDYRVIEFAQKVPIQYRINRYESKSILRDVAKSLNVHKEIINEKTKKGLFIPWASWNSSTDNTANRGKWNRRSFYNLMHSTWSEVLKEQSTTCTSCPTDNLNIEKVQLATTKDELHTLLIGKDSTIPIQPIT